MSPSPDGARRAGGPDLDSAPEVTVVVLCGGDSRRLGMDKTRQPFGRLTVLDYLLESLPGEWAVVAVGPRRPTLRAVTWVREQPPGGGPLAGITAGLSRVGTDLVAVVGGDMPFAAAGVGALVAALAADPSLEAATAAVEPRRPPDTRSSPPDTRSSPPDTRKAPFEAPSGPENDDNGCSVGGQDPVALRGNPLLVAYRTAAARAALPPDPAGGRARALLDAVPHLLVAVPEVALLDVDTAADLEAARALLTQRHR